MRKLLCAVLVAAGSLLLVSQSASAGLLSDPAGLPKALDKGAADPVHWRPWYHCHPRRGFCHGGRVHRPHWGYYHGPRWRHWRWRRGYAWGPRWRYRHWRRHW